MGSGTIDVPYSIEDTDTKECPVSLISAESFFLVQEITSAQHVHESSGAVLFGPDSGKWEAKFYDAVKLIQIQEIRIQNEEGRVIQRSG